MQKGPSQVSSGNITPAVMGPQKETKDIVILSGLVLLLAGLSAVAWIYSGTNEPKALTSSPDKVDPASVSDIFKKASPLNQAEASTTNSTPVTAPAAPPADIIHSDIYFEVGRKGLTDEAKAQLSAQGDLLKQQQDYAVLIQGYTDQQGSERYNKQLGMKRAETVKAELLKAGVAEHQMKVVSLGEEGVLCVDNSDVCRHLNRRVHLEIRKIGQEHLVIPAVATTAVDPAEPTIEQNASGQADGSTGNVPPSSSDPAITTFDPASGS
ncbi:OmpA family protein [Nitrospira sp. NS4]|uniref:OmpA family protein n=1 Tax=Nitrospira sp. NS4 TaxID=3414498 RepID=UPI003C2FFEBE